MSPCHCTNRELGVVFLPLLAMHLLLVSAWGLRAWRKRGRLVMVWLLMLHCHHLLLLGGNLLLLSVEWVLAV